MIEEIGECCYVTSFEEGREKADQVVDALKDEGFEVGGVEAVQGGCAAMIYRIVLNPSVLTALSLWESRSLDDLRRAMSGRALYVTKIIGENAGKRALALREERGFGTLDAERVHVARRRVEDILLIELARSEFRGRSNELVDWILDNAKVPEGKTFADKGVEIIFPEQ